MDTRVHFLQSERLQSNINVIPNSGKTDQCIVSKPLVHEIAPHHIMATPHETGLTAPPKKDTFHCIHKSLHHLVGKIMYSRPILHMQQPTNIQTQLSCLTKNAPASYYIYSWSDTICASKSSAAPHSAT